MICVGIDVAKDKHDCFILSSEGEVLADVFTIQNNAEGFDRLLQTIRRCTRPEDKIKVGLEATGHYSYNILGFLLDKGLCWHVAIYLPVWAAFSVWSLFAHGKAWLTLPALRSLQCHKVCLPLGPDLRRLSR